MDVPYAQFGDPQTLNLYGYVRNIPTSLVDGDGHGFVNEAFQDWGFDLGVPGWGTGNAQSQQSQSQSQAQGSQENGKCGIGCKLANIFRYGDVHWRTTTQIIDDERQYLRDKGVGVVGPDNKLIDLDKASNKQIDDAFRSLRNVEIFNSIREALGLTPIKLPSAPSWSFGSNKSTAKWQSQMAKRGWTNDQITEAIEKGQQFPAKNNINPANGATRYVNPTTGRSVVVDNVTREVLHVGGDGFKY